MYTFHLKYSQSLSVSQRSLQACHVVVWLFMETTNFFSAKILTLQIGLFWLVSVGQNFFPDSKFGSVVHNISDKEQTFELIFQLKYAHLSFALQRFLHAFQVGNILVLKILSLFGNFPSWHFGSGSDGAVLEFVQYFSPDTKSVLLVHLIWIEEHSWPWN